MGEGTLDVGQLGLFLFDYLLDYLLLLLQVGQLRVDFPFDVSEAVVLSLNQQYFKLLLGFLHD